MTTTTTLWYNQAMTKITPIRQGESLPFLFDRGGLPIEGWACEVVVKEYPGDTALITGTVEPTGNVFEGNLTSAQTEPLPPDTTYRLMGILTNATTDEEEQIESRFSVTASWNNVA